MFRPGLERVALHADLLMLARLSQAPGQSLRVHGRQLKSVEGDDETAPQVIDPHQTSVFVLPSAVLRTSAADYGTSLRGA